ncbi:unnamed protein product, partial [marine sediment metagenome]
LHIRQEKDTWKYYAGKNKNGVKIFLLSPFSPPFLIK